MNRRLLLGAGAAILLVAASFITGRALAGGRHATLPFDLNGPAYAAAAVAAGLSNAGFSGLEHGSQLAGAPLLSGRVIAVAGSEVTIASAHGPATLRLSGNRSLRQITAGAVAGLMPGATVIVIPDASGKDALSVLVITPD